MRYKLTSSFNDGKNDPPAIEIDTTQDSLLDAVGEELANDHGQPFGVGFTLTIERVA